MTCGARIMLPGNFTVTCEMTGHRKPETLGPTHMARTRSIDGRTVVIRWPTRDEPEGVDDDAEDEG